MRNFSEEAEPRILSAKWGTNSSSVEAGSAADNAASMAATSLSASRHAFEASHSITFRLDRFSSDGDIC